LHSPFNQGRRRYSHKARRGRDKEQQEKITQEKRVATVGPSLLTLRESVFSLGYVSAAPGSRFLSCGTEAATDIEIQTTTTHFPRMLIQATRGPRPSTAMRGGYVALYGVNQDLCGERL